MLHFSLFESSDCSLISPTLWWFGIFGLGMLLSDPCNLSLVVGSFYAFLMLPYGDSGFLRPRNAVK